MPTYQFVNRSGQMATVEAANPQEAMSKSQNRDPASGVQLVSAPAKSTANPPAGGATSDTQGQITQRISQEAITFAAKPEGYREQLIKDLKNQYGSQYSQFITDSVYSSLRSPTRGEPAYVAPVVGGTGGTTTDLTWLTSNPDYQGLPKDMQDYLMQYFKILKINDTETQKKLNDALEQAKAQANPYWAEIMTVAQDELSRTLKTKSDDFATQESYLTDQISRIKADLATRKGDLSIDEQAELARQAKKYEVDLDSLRENAAEAGLTFSTKRTQAESRLATENTDIVESTKTKYMREARDLETLAARGEKDALTKLAEYKRVLGESQMATLRAAESKLGTAGLPANLSLAPGVAPLGGVKGSAEEEKLKDIWQRAEALAGLGNPFLK